jgi:hypothetical protein
MSAFNQSKATVPAVRVIEVERQPVTAPESAKVIAIASVQAPAVRESRVCGSGWRSPWLQQFSPKQTPNTSTSACFSENPENDRGLRCSGTENQVKWTIRIAK